MANRQFAERLNLELDKMDAPRQMDERAEAFSKLVDIPRFQAHAILNGQIPHEELVLQRIADELEVSLDWLLEGKQ